jgi:DNA-binding response OmpR family regulator
LTDNQAVVFKPSHHEIYRQPNTKLNANGENILTTLLLIEDDLDAVRIVRKVLGRLGYDIQHSAKGLDGLRLAREINPDIVLVDMNLPDIEGKTIVLQLRGRILPATTAVVAFTAEDDARTRRIVKAFGCDDVIGKPVDTRAFPDQIAQIIQRKAAQKQNGV